MCDLVSVLELARWATVELVTVADWIQIISVFTVAVALVLSVLQLRELAHQTKAVGAALEQNAYQALLASRTELAAVFLDRDPDVIVWHLAGRGYDVSTPHAAQRVLFALLRINAHEANYLSYASGRASSDLWSGWKGNLVADFSIPEYRKLWPKARSYYAKSFVSFVDRIIIDPEHDVHKALH